MQIYIPSETCTGKPIAYFEDGEKEDLDKLINLEENYYIVNGTLFCKHSDRAPSYQVICMQ